MKRITIIGIAVLILGGAGLGLYFDPAVAARLTERLFGGNPDMKLDGKAERANGERENEEDEADYLLSRAAQIGFYRGISEDQPFEPLQRVQAVRQMNRQRAQRARSRDAGGDALQAVWTEIGPNPIPQGQLVSGTSSVSGRVSAIAVHPTNPNIVYVGTASGGLYRSTDGGANWTPLMDSALSLAIGSIAIAPSAPDTVYVGTGEAEASADSFFGVGIYRLTAASTAAPVLEGPFAGAEMNGRTISEIIVDPANANNLYATTASGVASAGGVGSPILPARGLFRSSNAAAPAPTFTKINVTGVAEDLNMYDAVIDPANFSRLLVSVVGSAAQSGVWLSTNANAAATFTRQIALAGTTSTTARTELAASGTTFYAASAQATGTLYRSNDGGVTWSTQINNNFCGQQCFYDIAVAADPTNANNVYLGGTGNTTTFAFSTNGGTTFTSSAVNLHTDTQAITVAPSLPSTIYFGSDGGIWKSTNNGANWTSLNNATFRATEFQSVAVHPTDPNLTLGGTQDNGTLYRSPANAWSLDDFGDGGFTAIDRNAVSTTAFTAYHGYVRIALYRKTTGYGTTSGWADISSGITGTALFYPPFNLGPGNPNSIYFGTTTLFRSATTGTAWTAASQNLGNSLSAVGISPQNDNVRIVGSRTGQLFGTTTGSATLIDLDPTGTVPNSYIGRSVIDPNNPNTAYVTLCAFGVPTIWKTTNYNNLNTAVAPTWTSASNGLPQTPVNVIIVDPASSNNLYAGTDIGVYVSTDAGANWAPFGTGLPALPVFDIAITSNNLLRIATHGRGMWTLPKVGASFAPLLTAGSATLVSESLLPANGVIDPGETVTVAFGVQNTGNANTASDVGTLQNTGGVTKAGAPQNYGALAANAAETTRNFTFTADRRMLCGTVITATVHHQDGATDLGNLIYRLPTGIAAAASNTFSYTGPPAAVPDNSAVGADLVLPVSGLSGLTGDVNFRLDALPGCDTTAANTNASVTHTFVSDLAFSLRSPAGTTVNLIANRGGAGANICTVTLDDDGGFPSISTLPTTGAASGSFAPESPLSAFDGEDPNGSWTLHVVDSGPADIGTVNRFSLIVSGKSCTLAPTAAGVTLGGRVNTPAGRGLTNATVRLTTADGQTRTTRTTTFGAFRFDGINAGQTVSVSVEAKRYTFAPQVVNLTGDLGDLRLTANR